MFRLNAKSLFLTYPKTEKLNTKNKVHRLLKAKFANNISCIITSFETSDNDHPYEHFHVFLKLINKVDIKNQNFLDLENVHGHYQTVKSEKKVIDYVTKCDDFLSDGEVAQRSYSKKSLSLLLKHKIIQLKTWKKFQKFHHLSKNEVLKYVMNGLDEETRISIFLNKKAIFDALNEELSTKYSWWKYCPKYKLSDFNIPRTFIEWLRRHKSKLTCVIIGPSGKGKTQLALSAFNNPLLVSHTDNLKELTDSHDGIVFDDMNFSHWPRESVIHLTDLEETRGINVKGDVANIPAKLPRIITSNKDILELLPIDPHGSINRRIHIVIISDNWNMF